MIGFRASDLSTGLNPSFGLFTFIEQGIVNSNSGWVLADVAQTINLSLSVNSTNDGNKFYLNNVRQSIINFRKGDTIIIDVSAVGKSSSNHPIKFSTTENGTHNGGSSYTTDITESGDYITINTTSNTPSNLYYYCELHSDMGSSIVHSDNISVATVMVYIFQNFLVLVQAQQHQVV